MLADRVLDAAATCIARVGLTKTTLDDVAREAGCSRATLYRYFPGKQQLVCSLVGREIDRLATDVLAAAGATTTLADAATAAVTTAARAVRDHAALTFVMAHEPEVLLPYLAFAHDGLVLRGAAEFVAPAFTPYLSATEAVRLGEWTARLTLSYLCSPSEHLDICDEQQVRGLVVDFVLPGFVRPVHSEGVSR